MVVRRRAVVRDLPDLFMPSQVSTLDPANGVAGVLDIDRLASTAALVSGKDSAGLAAIDAVCKQLRREASKDDQVQDTNTPAGKKGR